MKIQVRKKTRLSFPYTVLGQPKPEKKFLVKINMWIPVETPVGIFNKISG
jgi:hypothetical protein